MVNSQRFVKLGPWDPNNNDSFLGTTTHPCLTRWWPIFVFYQKLHGHKALNHSDKGFVIYYYKNGVQIGDKKEVTRTILEKYNSKGGN